MKLLRIYKGGENSGHHGHRGRIGQVGGSLPGKAYAPNSSIIDGMPSPGTEAYDTVSKLLGITYVNDVTVRAKIQAMYNYEMPSLRMRAEIGRIWILQDGSIRVMGTIYAPWAKAPKTAEPMNVGHFQNSLILEEDGTRTASHDSWSISPGARGNGFGSSFYQFIEDEYIRQGFDKLVLFAGDDVGGYAWARLGFDWNMDFWTDVKGYSVQECIAEVMRVAGDVWSERYDTPLPAGLDHPWDIAMLKGPDGYPIGRDILPGTQWPGIKDLHEGSINVAIGKAYYNAKRTAQRETKNDQD